jgi:hypothetical protein
MLQWWPCYGGIPNRAKAPRKRREEVVNEGGEMLAERIDPETMGRIEEAVRELAEMGYPKVWVGEAGTTPGEALADDLYSLAERKRAWEESRLEEREELWAQLPEDETRRWRSYLPRA